MARLRVIPPHTWAHSFGPTHFSFLSSTIMQELSDGTVVVLLLLPQYISMRNITFSTFLFIIIMQNLTYKVLTQVFKHLKPVSFTLPPPISMNFVTPIQTKERQRSFWLSLSRGVDLTMNPTTTSLKPPLQHPSPQLDVQLKHSLLMTFTEIHMFS